jgi:xyloglucan-specific endo-beta-1,4-glucanase
VYSWYAKTNIKNFDFDVTPLIKELSTSNFVPLNTYIGTVEFGSEAFFATENITFSASKFDMFLESKNSPRQRPSTSPTTSSISTTGTVRPSLGSLRVSLPTFQVIIFGILSHMFYFVL